MPNRQDREAARYRRAAEVALDQVDWCVRYLHRIRKDRLASQLAHNHHRIKRKLMR